MREKRIITITQMMRSYGTKWQTGKKQNVKNPLHSAGTDSNLNEGHGQIQETKGMKIN
jgi:hypothetical protein